MKDSGAFVSDQYRAFSVGTFLMLCFQLLRFPRLASIQAQIFLVLSVIYPSITRSALRFVHCVAADDGTSILESAPAEINISTSDGFDVIKTEIPLRFAAACVHPRLAAIGSCRSRVLAGAGQESTCPSVWSQC